jgi:methyl-accepting chemotaxis protein
MLKNTKIGTKVTLLLSIIILIAFSSMTVITYNSSASILENEINNNMQNQAVNNSNILAEKLNVFKAEVSDTSSKTEIKTMDWNVQKAVLIEDAKKYGFMKMGVATPDGNAKYSNDETTNIVQRAYFLDAMKGQINISDPIISTANNKLVVVFAAPITDASGTVKEVLVGTADGEFLSELTKTITIGKTGYGFAINSTGTYIGNKDETTVAKQENVITEAKKDKSLVPFANIESKMISGAKGVDTCTYKNVEKYVAYAPIQGTKWSLGVAVDTSEMMSSVNALRNQMIVFLIAVFAIIVLLCLLIIRRLVSGPLKTSLNMIEELAKGHLKGRLKISSGDEVGKMSRAMNMLADTLQFNILGAMKQIAEGDMNVEIERKDKDDEITPVIMETAATVKEIVNDTSEIIESVNEGVLDNRCNDTNYKGDWKTLAQKINTLCDSVSTPIEEVCGVIEKISVNDYTEKVDGQYKGVFKNLADEVNMVQYRLLNLQDVVIKVSKGDTSSLEQYEKIGKLSENDKLVPATIEMMRAIENLISEVQHMTEESANGNVVNTHGDEGKFEGGYKEIVKGINSTLSAVSSPLSEVFNVLGKMSVNDYTLKMDDNYKGDFQKLAQAVNDVQTRLLMIQNTAILISNGDISELEDYRAIGKRSENDKLMPAFTRMMESIELLIDETTRIADSAAEGKLDVRGDATRFNGGYSHIVKAVNTFLEAVEKPTNQITSVMNSISNADFGVIIDGEFHGQFKEMVDSVNATSKQLSAIITEVSSIITRMAGGDFSFETLKEYKGDFKAFSDALNTILNSLNELFSNVSETSAQVAAGSAQVSQGSQMLSQGATEQASSVEELTASITEIASQTKQNAMNASKANSLAAEAKTSASTGRSQMKDMLKSMDAISESSMNISKIIKVIDDIAFQTNILALNAAVEAARAGQYGKGFAVVAEEVRNLAAKSAGAAKDTTLLIEGTVNKVASGTEIARGTAKAFDGIVDGVDKVAGLVSEIADASNEQATGISQVDKGLEQVSKVIQTNSATSEQSAAASEELSSQAAILEGQVKKFTLRSSRKANKSAGISDKKIAFSNTKTPEPEKPVVSLDDEFGKY